MNKKINFFKQTLTASIVAAGVLCVPQHSYGATQNANMPVSVTVVGHCTVAAAPIVFPNYDPGDGPSDVSPTPITVNCPVGQHYTTSLSAGQTGTYANRHLVNGVNTINYNLYTDAGFANVWGDGTVGTVTLPGIGTGANQLLPVFGHIPAGQPAVPLGLYNDVVVVTLTY